MWKLICYKDQHDKQGTLVQSFENSVQAVDYMMGQANNLSKKFREWELKRDPSMKEKLS